MGRSARTNLHFHYLILILRELQQVGKVKVKVTLKQATRTERGSRNIALFFILDARWGGRSTPRHATLCPR